MSMASDEEKVLLQTLRDNLLALAEDGQDSDVTLVVGPRKKEYKLHQQD